VPVGPDENVGRLHVAVNQSLSVHVVHHPAKLAQDGAHLFKGQRTTLANQTRERLTLQHLHHHERTVAVPAYREDWDQIRMFQRGGCSGFTFKPGNGRGIRAQMGQQQLHRDFPAKAHVRRLHDHSHAPLSQLAVHAPLAVEQIPQLDGRGGGLDGSALGAGRAKRATLRVARGAGFALGHWPKHDTPFMIPSMADWTTSPLDRSALLGGDSAGISARWRVEVIGGPDQGKSAYIDGALQLGSDPASGFALTDETISWHHAAAEPGPEGVRFTDLGSTNGTFLGGAQVQQFVAGHETLFCAGRTLFRVSRESPDNKAQGPSTASFGRALGTTPVMQQLFATLRRGASSESTVLILGETGTGKELLAEGIHQASGRKQGPFVVLDCGAVAPGLIEAELFGHTRGAFTGADQAREGAFLRAGGGTLFLDEVGELPLEAQPKLLRALDARTVQRVGGREQESSDVRIVAATHRDLEAEVKAGRFREDLYFRLAVVTVRVPPLRERREDVPLLVRAFLASLGRPDFVLSSALQDRLERHTWPGNVRELKNVVERALLGLGMQQVPDRPALSRTQDGADLSTLQFKEAKARLIEQFSQEYFEALFTRCDRNVSKMARIAGIARPYAHEVVKKYGLKASEGE
jgi:two-component system nitrogen regulation response regulator GlnG